MAGREARAWNDACGALHATKSCTLRPLQNSVNENVGKMSKN